MNFPLCLNTSTIKPQPLLEKIRLTAEAGYAGVELWLTDLYEHVGQGGEISDVETALADTGLIVPCMIALNNWGDRNGHDYKVALEEAKRRMELAARIGSPHVVATPPPGVCDLHRLAEKYRDLLKIGRAVGVKPTFEYISFFTSVSKLSHAWQVVQETGEEDATLVVDAFHSWNSGSTWDDLRAIPAERISHYHIDDASTKKPALTQTDGDRVMIGSGAIDLAAEITVLKEIGYSGAISLELFNQELWNADPAEVLRIGMEELYKLFPEA